jgi:hypothetical protein
MTTHMLKTSMVSETTLDWLKRKYMAVDSRDHAGYAQFLSGDCQLQFANNPVVQGEACLLAGIDNFWRSIHGLNHNFIAVLGNDDHLALEAIIDYTRADDNIVKTPCVTIIERNKNGEAKNIKIFLDLAPVFAPAK